MKTTNLFIELLVIGVGAMLCIGLLSYNLFGSSHFSDMSFNSSLLLLPTTAITYVLGIVFDRIFDIITNKWDKKIRVKSKIEDRYDIIRTVTYNDSKVIQDVFDYTKNRIRIVRSWMFYFFILSVLIAFTPNISLSTRVTSSICFLILSALTLITFRKLSYSFYGLLNKSYNNMTDKSATK